jgi:hypothetical protein
MKSFLQNFFNILLKVIVLFLLGLFSRYFASINYFEYFAFLFAFLEFKHFTYMFDTVYPFFYHGFNISDDIYFRSSSKTCSNSLNTKKDDGDTSNILRESVAHSNRSDFVDSTLFDRFRRKVY